MRGAGGGWEPFTSPEGVSGTAEQAPKPSVQVSVAGVERRPTPAAYANKDDAPLSRTHAPEGGPRVVETGPTS